MDSGDGAAGDPPRARYRAVGGKCGPACCARWGYHRSVRCTAPASRTRKRWRGERPRLAWASGLPPLGGATIYFADEAGIRSDYHSGTTWAPVGATPVVANTGERFSVNMISAVTAKGALRFAVYEGTTKHRELHRFLHAVDARRDRTGLSDRGRAVRTIRVVTAGLGRPSCGWLRRSSPRRSRRSRSGCPGLLRARGEPARPVASQRPAARYAAR